MVSIIECENKIEINLWLSLNINNWKYEDFGKYWGNWILIET